MSDSLRGRPKLNIEMDRILEAIRRHGQVVAAARELKCSDAYIHQRLKAMGLTLGDVLEEGPQAKGFAPFPLGLCKHGE